MSFTEEDRRKVLTYFELLLLEKDAPVLCESLRQHVVDVAPDVVKRYVAKECKGELLLDFFKKRKNSFLVDKGAVALKRKQLKKLTVEDSSHDSKGKTQTSTLPSIKRNDDVKVEDEKVSNKAGKRTARRSSVCSSSSLPEARARVKTNPRRRNATYNSYFDQFSEDSSTTVEEPLSEADEKLKRQAVEYFCSVLARHETIWLGAVELHTLPEKIRRFVCNRGKKIGGFFHKLPEYFVVDRDGFITLAESCCESLEVNFCDLDKLSMWRCYLCCRK